MKIKYLNVKAWLLGITSAVLGINVGCDRNSIVSEYGCPEVTYRVSGRVTNGTGNGISGIDVCHGDTTDAEGCYNTTVWDNFPGDTIEVEFRDIDGAEHGSYEDTLVRVGTNDVELHGADGHWYLGSGEVHLDVTMREKIEHQ